MCVGEKEGRDLQIRTAKDKIDENSPWKKETIVSSMFQLQKEI